MGEPQFFRCQTCGNLITDSMIQRGICAGHKVKYATKGNLWEWLKIKLGMIK